MRAIKLCRGRTGEKGKEIYKIEESRSSLVLNAATPFRCCYIIIIIILHVQTFVANGYFADLAPKFSLTNAKLTIRQFLMVR